MAADICFVLSTGRLTRDAELKYTSGGIPVVRFSIAVNKRRKIQNEWTEVGHFFDCVYWGVPAEAISRYLVKGKSVTISGELNQNRWEQDGESRSKVEIMIHEVKLGSDGHQGSSNQSQESPQRHEGGPPRKDQFPADKYPYPQEYPDDIPF